MEREQQSGEAEKTEQCASCGTLLDTDSLFQCEGCMPRFESGRLRRVQTASLSLDWETDPDIIGVLVSAPGEEQPATNE